MDIETDQERLTYRPYLTPKQWLAKETLERDDVKEVLYGGAKGGGKSVFGCLWCFLQCLKIIEDCKIFVLNTHHYEFLLFCFLQVKKQNTVHFINGIRVLVGSVLGVDKSF